MNQSALESAVLTRLEQLSIPYRLMQHEAVYTMEDAERLHLDGDTRPVKNLFLRDSSKKHFFLVSLDAEKNWTPKPCELSCKAAA